MFNNAFYTIPIALCFCLATSSAAAKYSNKISDHTYLTKPTKARHDSIERIIRAEMANLLLDPHFSAVSGVVVSHNDTYQIHMGKLADLQVPNDRTLYEIGSLTKTYTAILISQAVFDHKVDLDVDIRQYLKGKWPHLILKNGRPVTLRHLITHTSGLPMNLNCDQIGQSVKERAGCLRSFTKKNFFDQLALIDLKEATGDTYRYSNAGVQLAGYIAEDAYASNQKKLLKKYVFERSKEDRTYIMVPANYHHRLAGGKDSSGTPMPVIDGGYSYAGGLKASTRSMSRFINMYLKGNDPVVEQTMTLLAGNEQYGRAYIWNTYQYATEDRMLYHSGGTFGSSSWLAIYPKSKVGIFLVTNVMTNDTQRKLNEVSNKIYEKLKSGRYL